MRVQRERVEGNVLLLDGGGVGLVQAVVLKVPAVLLVEYIDGVFLRAGVFHLRIPAEHDLVSVDRLDEHARFALRLFYQRILFIIRRARAERVDRAAERVIRHLVDKIGIRDPRVGIRIRTDAAARQRGQERRRERKKKRGLSYPSVHNDPCLIRKAPRRQNARGLPFLNALHTRF